MDIILPTHIAETIDHFSGRTWLLPKILDWFDNQPDPLLMLVGKPGTGKSMIAAWLAGFGPEPAEPADQANLRRLRELLAGAHFCQINSDQNAPKTMADQLARQITRRVDGFDEGVQAILGKKVEITVTQKADKVEPGASMTGVYIGRLDLGRLLGPGGVEQALIRPLRWLYDQGYAKKILLLIDSLDEAQLYKNDYRITDAVLELAKLNLPVRILATVRDETDALSLFRAYRRIDLIRDAPDYVDDIGDYVNNRLKGAVGLRVAELGQRIKDNAKGNFLFAHLVIDDLINRLRSKEVLDVDDVPDSLSQHYHDFMQRLGMPSQWEKRYSKLLGLTAVAQDTGLETPLIAGMLARTPDSTLRDLKAVKPFLEGNLDNGPFRSFHKSFTEFLLEDETNNDYRISSPTPHANIVYYYWPRNRTDPPEENWDSYARLHIITHLAGAGRSLNQAERHLMAKRMVERVSDPVLRDLGGVDLRELGEIGRDLAAAVVTACGDDLLEGLPLVMRAVRAHQTFYQAVLKPAHIFEHAAKGDVETALEKLSLFTMEPRWQKAARLGIAWLAAESRPMEAAALRDQVSQVPPFPAPLNRLLARVNHALGGPEPDLLPLPNPPSESVLEEILAGLLGNKINLEMIQNYRSGLNIEIDLEFSEELNAQGDQVPAYQALEDAPILVSFVNDNKEQGEQYFQQYMQVQAANLYIYYRNIALWILMEAVLRHPDPKWSRQALRQVLELALAGEAVPFEENTPIVLLGLRAASGLPKALVELDQRKQDVISRARELDESRRHSDVYGQHKRKLCGLALAYQAQADGAIQVQELLSLALQIPRGFAGFMYKAWLTLYETLLICQWPNPLDLTHCLEEALRSAHKIQDPNFCVLATARMRKLRDHWPSVTPSPAAVRKIVEEFARKPLSPSFAPIHAIADTYLYRYDAGADMMPLPDPLINANTLWQIAEQLGLSLEGLLEINDDLHLGQDTPIPVGAMVRLYDPDFVPLIAQRLSAEVLTAKLEPREKRRLLQMLIPHALPNRTMLDTVLARLLFASGSTEFDALDVSVSVSEPPVTGGEVTGVKIGFIGEEEQPAGKGQIGGMEIRDIDIGEL